MSKLFERIGEVADLGANMGYDAFRTLVHQAITALHQDDPGREAIFPAVHVDAQTATVHVTLIGKVTQGDRLSVHTHVYDRMPRELRLEVSSIEMPAHVIALVRDVREGVEGSAFVLFDALCEVGILANRDIPKGVDAAETARVWVRDAALALLPSIKTNDLLIGPTGLIPTGAAAIKVAI